MGITVLLCFACYREIVKELVEEYEASTRADYIQWGSRPPKQHSST